MSYTIDKEDGSLNLTELFPIYAIHYREMQERLSADGMTIGDFNPRIDAYVSAWQSGTLQNYCVRHNGKAVGYGNVWITNDMHNGELIAQEDTVFVLKDHRNGVGKGLVQYILDDLRTRGVKRANVTAMTDLRVAKLWQRMGFRHTAHAMTYFFED